MTTTDDMPNEHELDAALLLIAEPVAMSEQVRRTHAAVADLIKALEADAGANPAAWHAITCLKRAQYDLWGAYGYLALEEQRRR